MNHNWPYKQIGKLSNALIEKLAKQIITIPYTSSVDFPSNVITCSFPPFLTDAKEELSAYFDPTGHIHSNIARQHPMTYMREHSDYKTKGPLVNVLDDMIKIQIPIITNAGVAMMWPDEDAGHYVKKFEVGGIYVIDNIRIHSVINLGDTHRYNLTMRYKASSVIDPAILD